MIILKSRLHSSWNAFLDIIYPRTCLVCKSALANQEEHICISCRLLLPVIHPDSFELELLESRFWGKVQLDGVIACLKYEKNGPVQKILKSIKYHKNKDLAFFMGKFAGALLRSEYNFEADLVIPVPLHPKKELQRGFNQSECIAEGISETLEVPCVNEVVKRLVNTQTQTKLNREERWENVKSIFDIDFPDKIEGKNVVLLDDVVTTGSTLESLALKVAEQKPRSIKVIALAMAD
jgi:ComF family protein